MAEISLLGKTQTMPSATWVGNDAHDAEHWCRARLLSGEYGRSEHAPEPS